MSTYLQVLKNYKKVEEPAREPPIPVIAKINK
jgi:hypothetical protein